MEQKVQIRKKKRTAEAENLRTGTVVVLTLRVTLRVVVQAGVVRVRSPVQLLDRGRCRGRCSCWAGFERGGQRGCCAHDLIDQDPRGRGRRAS